MNQIKFSHFYEKLGDCDLNDGEKVVLMLVLHLDRAVLSPTFEVYDTHYHDENGRVQRYPLPNGEVILLLFRTTHGLMPTIRRYTPEKMGYYKGKEGEEFEVKIA